MLYLSGLRAGRLHRRGEYRRTLLKRQEREHATSPPFLGAIGIIAVQVARGADSRIIHRRNAEITALAHDLRSEIDFIMRWSNAGTELDHQI